MDFVEGAFDAESGECNLVNARLKEVPDLKQLEGLRRLILRQNEIDAIPTWPDNVVKSLEHLDLYLNSIKHIENLHSLTKLVFLDLSFNEIRRIENLDALVELK